MESIESKNEQNYSFRVYHDQTLKKVRLITKQQGVWFATVYK